MFELENGKRYSVKIKLSIDEIGFDNETLEALAASVGFGDVEVHGGGTVRHAVGTWTRRSQSIELPSQVESVEEVSVA
jgi:hypothetical protein